MTDRLTDRERQILELAAQHLTSKQIGPRLGIRPASVDTFMQAIIRKLGVAGRKAAVISYLASRATAAEGRDDLDFGSSPVDRADNLDLARGVTMIDDPEALSSSDTAWRLAQAVGGRTGRPSQAKTTLGLAHRGVLKSPAWRLVAIAIVALVLGFVTLVAVAVGYGLNRTFDRILVDHSLHPAAGRTKVRVPNMHNLTGARIAKQLFSAEDAIDVTLGETAKLIASMCEARIANRLPAVAGQRAIGGAADALAALERARRSVLDTHEGLASLREEYGLEVVGAGVLHKPEVVAPGGSLGAAVA